MKCLDIDVVWRNMYRIYEMNLDNANKDTIINNNVA